MKKREEFEVEMQPKETEEIVEPDDVQMKFFETIRKFKQENCAICS